MWPRPPGGLQAVPPKTIKARLWDCGPSSDVDDNLAPSASGDLERGVTRNGVPVAWKILAPCRPASVRRPSVGIAADLHSMSRMGLADRTDYLHDAYLHSNLHAYPEVHAYYFVYICTDGTRRARAQCASREPPHTCVLVGTCK